MTGVAERQCSIINASVGTMATCHWPSYISVPVVTAIPEQQLMLRWGQDSSIIKQAECATVTAQCSRRGGGDDNITCLHING